LSDNRTTVTFIGTSSVTPGGGHDTASFIINGKLLVDTGWYSAVKIQSHGFSPLDLEFLALTHCHHDHYMALPQHFFFHSQRQQDRPESDPLRILGPASDVERVVGLAWEFLQVERFPTLEVPVEVCPIEPGASYEAEDFRLETIQSLHPVEGLIYRFTDKQTAASVVCTGDTAPHSDLPEFARGADLLIHEASHGARRSSKESRYGHSGAPEAAEIAKAAGVKRLALVHCAEKDQAAALEAAQEIFPDTFWPEEGSAVFVE